jgi:hypothetical protein
MTTELATLLASQARHVALARVVRAHPEMTLEQLESLGSSKYQDEFCRLTVGELLSEGDEDVLGVRRGEPLEAAVLRVFRQLPDHEFASSFFTRHMGLERWTAQALLSELAERGLLIRSGKTSSTRYRLAILP